MPDISVSEEQYERLEDIQEDVENAFIDTYGSVQMTDAIKYLLDTYTPPGESHDTTTEPESDLGETDAATVASEAKESAPHNGGPIGKANQLLEEHDDKWQQASGDEPYEVELPDGSTESARTKDDVRQLLFRHY